MARFESANLESLDPSLDPASFPIIRLRRTSQEMPRIQKCLLLWSVLVVFVATGLGSFNWWKYLHLSTRGVRHEAIILGLFSQEHQVVTYQYEVTRHSYAGRGQSWAPNPQLEQLHAGQSVEIFYDPEHPETYI